jgi:glycosyltransferase involved in cell wall biosynthesis
VKFSVLFCVNRDTPFLDAALASVLAQTHADFEFIIVANACPDALWVKVQRFAGTDPRVRAYRTAIGQLCFNLNYAADLAIGEYLMRMDADDISRPDRFEVLARAIVQHRPDVIGSCAVWIDERGRPLDPLDVPLRHADIVRRLPWKTPFIHPSVAIRRAALLEARGYIGGFASEDYELWIRMARWGAQFMNVQERLLEYRTHSGQTIASGAGYAEVAGYWLREVLDTGKPRAILGLLIASGKALRHKWLTRGKVNG